MEQPNKPLTTREFLIFLPLLLMAVVPVMMFAIILFSKDYWVIHIPVVVGFVHFFGGNGLASAVFHLRLLPEEFLSMCTHGFYDSRVLGEPQAKLGRKLGLLSLGFLVSFYGTWALSGSLMTAIFVAAVYMLLAMRSFKKHPSVVK